MSRIFGPGEGAIGGSSAVEQQPEVPPIPPLRVFEVLDENDVVITTVHAHEETIMPAGALAFYQVREVEGVGRASTCHHIFAEGIWAQVREVVAPVAPPIPVEFQTNGLLN